MNSQWELTFLDLVNGKEQGFKATCLRALLLLLSYPYRFAVALRNSAYSHGWLTRYHPPVPLVVSVGNLTVGGTGKTPFVLLLASQFVGMYRVAILSRGYRSEAEKIASPILLCKQEGRTQSANYCGDEPYLLVDHLPNALIVVGKDRGKASNMASRAGAKLLILDDGFQHRRLARDIDIVILQSDDLFGTGYLLPRGLLREDPSALSRADLVVINLGRREDRQSLSAQIRQYTSKPIIWVRMRATALKTLSGEVISSIRGKKVGLFCGIAMPEKFQDSVEALGAQVTSIKTMADHTLNILEVQEFAKQCREKGAEFIICTEKDKVKLNNSLETALPIIWLQMVMEVVNGLDQWEKLLEQMHRSLECRM